MGVFGSGMVGGTHLSIGEVTASKSSAVTSRSRRFRPPGSASCSHARDPSAETTKIAVSTRQAGRARLPARGAAKEKIPGCEFNVEQRQGRRSARPDFECAEAAHLRPEPVDSFSTPDGRAAGLPCARRIETCAAVRAKPARKNEADVRGRADACCRIACMQQQRPPSRRPGALRAAAAAAHAPSTGCRADGPSGRAPCLASWCPAACSCSALPHRLALGFHAQAGHPASHREASTRELEGRGGQASRVRPRTASLQRRALRSRPVQHAPPRAGHDTCTSNVALGARWTEQPRRARDAAASAPEQLLGWVE